MNISNIVLTTTRTVPECYLFLKYMNGKIAKLFETNMILQRNILFPQKPSKISTSHCKILHLNWYTFIHGTFYFVYFHLPWHPKFTRVQILHDDTFYLGRFLLVFRHINSDVMINSLWLLYNTPNLRRKLDELMKR